MKTLSLIATLLAATPLIADATVTKEDVKKLAQAGIGDDVILSFIRANGPVPTLSSDDVIDLKNSGVSDRVITALLNPAPARVEPQPVQREVVEKKVYVETAPTVVYTTPAYYSYSSSWCRSHWAYDGCTTYTPYYSSYSYYPRTSYSCSPSYSFGYYRGHHRRSWGWSVGYGCW